MLCLESKCSVKKVKGVKVKVDIQKDWKGFFALRISKTQRHL